MSVRAHELLIAGDPAALDDVMYQAVALVVEEGDIVGKSNDVFLEQSSEGRIHCRRLEAQETPDLIVAAVVVARVLLESASDLLPYQLQALLVHVGQYPDIDIGIERDSAALDLAGGKVVGLEGVCIGLLALEAATCARGDVGGCPLGGGKRDHVCRIGRSVLSHLNG